ncbi:MAG TPA: FHA domain-containing protein [Candidatus Sumerlaeota bacterium]|nr:FHA domain-containing protein [Candidatus Sumerlaeota bacterium]HMZ50962.1 FHA domain-containing protein [Candidatus Sumerlaeota bacterium]HNM47365.1 FHA domain-containing protein [Candidatus Sumerlaeota bacterium]
MGVGDSISGTGTKPGKPRAAMVKTFMIAMASEVGPRLLAFNMNNVLVGRMPDNHLAINHASVSRRHATISITPKGVVIEDMNSQNGVTINGSAIHGKANIRPGDIIRIGHVPLFYFGFINQQRPPEQELVENSIQITPIVPTL